VRPARDDQLTTVSPVDIHALGRRHASDFVDGIEDGVVDLARGLAAVQLRQAGERDVEAWSTPPAVAPGCAEAGDVALEQNHAQRPVGAQKVVSRPQARVAGAEDGDICVDRPV
jgi:hypothetical protein